MNSYRELTRLTSYIRLVFCTVWPELSECVCLWTDGEYWGMPGLRRELYFQVHPEVTGPRNVWEQKREDQANLGTNLHVSHRTSQWTDI